MKKLFACAIIVMIAILATPTAKAGFIELSISLEEGSTEYADFRTTENIRFELVPLHPFTGYQEAILFSPMTLSGDGDIQIHLVNLSQQEKEGITPDNYRFKLIAYKDDNTVDSYVVIYTWIGETIEQESQEQDNTIENLENRIIDLENESIEGKIKRDELENLIHRLILEQTETLEGFKGFTIDQINAINSIIAQITDNPENSANNSDLKALETLVYSLVDSDTYYENMLAYQNNRIEKLEGTQTILAGTIIGVCVAAIGLFGIRKVLGKGKPVTPAPAPIVPQPAKDLTKPAPPPKPAVTPKPSTDKTLKKKKKVRK